MATYRVPERTVLTYVPFAASNFLAKSDDLPVDRNNPKLRNSCFRSLNIKVDTPSCSVTHECLKSVS